MFLPFLTLISEEVNKLSSQYLSFLCDVVERSESNEQVYYVLIICRYLINHFNLKKECNYYA